MNLDVRMLHTSHGKLRRDAGGADLIVRPPPDRRKGR
jgi:hypothetical protein